MSILTLTEPRIGDRTPSPRKCLAPPCPNPITQSEITPKPIRKSKSSVPSYMQTPNPLLEKTEGIALTPFTAKGRGSFAFSYKESESFTPSRRHIPHYNSAVQTPTKVRKQSLFHPPRRDPILEGCKEEFSYKKPSEEHSYASTADEVIKGKGTITPVMKVSYKERSELFDPDCLEVKLMDRKKQVGAAEKSNMSEVIGNEKHKLKTSEKPNTSVVKKDAYINIAVANELARMYGRRGSSSKFEIR